MFILIKLILPTREKGRPNQLLTVLEMEIIIGQQLMFAMFSSLDTI